MRLETDLPLVVRADLEDAEPRLAFHGEHAFCHAYLVVVVLLVKREGEERAHQVDEQLLCRGLAVASRYGDEGGRRMLPFVTG